MMVKKNSLKACGSVLMLLLLGACSSGDETALDPSLGTDLGAVQTLHSVNVNQHKLNEVVCDPMGGEGNPGIHDGLIAELFYLPDTGVGYNSVDRYIEEGIRSSQELFFTDVNIPTRVFSDGFPKQTGGVVQTDDNRDLYENFALRFKSTLKLSESNPEGEYELALLSDDGAILRIVDEDGAARVVVDNDGNHPTRMGCGDTVYFDESTSYDVIMDYYQGPRYHISLIPMWRRVTDSTAQETECGKKGNSRYFDYNNGSTPKSAYTDMLLRGWEPIAAENWHLPPLAGYNPCVEGTNPLISNVQLQASNEGFATVSWTTDIPATSQVLVKDEFGNEVMTESDNVLRTEHSVFLSSEIRIGETYTFQAVSISADMGKTLSRVLEASF